MLLKLVGSLSFENSFQLGIVFDLNLSGYIFVSAETSTLYLD